MKKIIWFIDNDERLTEVVKTESPNMTEDYEVQIITNPIVIDAKLEETLPELIFIDMDVVGHGEHNVIKDIKVRDVAKKIPVVLMAADVKIKDKALELGADGYLQKPFDMKQFFESVKRRGKPEKEDK